MVKGLDIFRGHFSGFYDQYTVIGGTACDLAMEGAGLEFRATKDIDLVLCVETLSEDFTREFWKFIAAGGYEHRQKSDGEPQFYRFKTPKDDEFPFMIELFSKVPNQIEFEGEGHITPIPTEEEVSSLSAILLREDYYQLIHENKRIVEELPTLGPEHLIVLKARAFVDLTKRKNDGEDVDSKDVKKHRNDVFRLNLLLPSDINISLPEAIRSDLDEFFDMVSADEVPLRNLGYANLKFDEVVAQLKVKYSS